MFGQSKRELLDRAWFNRTVPLALTLLNSPPFARITKARLRAGKQSVALCIAPASMPIRNPHGVADWKHFLA